MTASKIEWTETLKARFWSYVDRRGPEDCWPWKGGIFTKGYGQFRAGPRKLKAHRVAFELERSSIEPGLIACHRCDNPPCCNPAHLFLGSHADNARDRSSKGRTRAGRVSMPGALNPAAKLRREQVEEIRRLAASGVLQREIAARYSISQNQVGNIVRGVSWA